MTLVCRHEQAVTVQNWKDGRGEGGMDGRQEQRTQSTQSAQVPR